MTAHPAPTRRALVRGAAWSVPVISLAAAAPAFAASPVMCQPIGCRYGSGNDKDFILDINCSTTQPVVSVTINNKTATRIYGEWWALYDQRNTSDKLAVKITTADGGTHQSVVTFTSCGGFAPRTASDAVMLKDVPQQAPVQ